MVCMKYIPKGKILQGGIGYYSLCRDCNTFLGHNYVKAYEKWVMTGIEVISKYNCDYFKYIALEQEPLKVLKQIISMFLAMNEDWYLVEYPELSEFVKDPHSVNLPKKYRVFVYLNKVGQYRYCKHTMMFHPELGIINFTELTFPPFGYVLTFNFDHGIDKFVNITNFKNSTLNSKVDIELGLFKLPTHLPFSPLDYRPKEKIEKDIEAGNLIKAQAKNMSYKSGKQSQPPTNNMP